MGVKIRNFDLSVSYWCTTVGRGLAPAGHFAKQNDIDEGDNSLFPFGKSQIASQFGRAINDRPYIRCFINSPINRNLTVNFQLPILLCFGKEAIAKNVAIG